MQADETNPKITVLWVCAFLALGFACPATAQIPPDPQLREENIVLLWNPADDESALIAAAYLDRHPGVISFPIEDALPDYGINYDNYPPNNQPNPLCSGCSPCSSCSICEPNYNLECYCCSCPSFALGVWNDSQSNPLLWAMNKYYMTPEMYEHFIAQPLRQFLVDYANTYPPEEGYEPIVAIVTTRGVPATISESFESGINHSDTCIKGSLESHLAALNFTGKGNPYHGHLGIPFKSWINTPATDCNPDGGLEYKGKIFLTSRLDSDLQFPQITLEIPTHAEAVLALIERSCNLVVNKFACTIVVDVNAGTNSGLARDDGNYFRARRWPVFYDNTSAFLHGANQPQGSCGTLDPALEGQYASWPELVHYTFGRNSYVFAGGGEPVCNDYVKYYKPHPAGLFLSFESWNGLALRDPNWPYASDQASGGWTQGSVLQWIGSGGSFAIGAVNGFGVTSIPSGVYSVANFYEFGLSWGEAAWSEEILFNSFVCPIGDPLARVTVYDPDVTGDGEIDMDDVDLVLEHWEEPGPEGDINHDGIVNEDDLTIIAEAWGRKIDTLPALPPQTEPWPPVPTPTANRCGDLNGDGVVDAYDLALFDDRIALCGSELYSGMFDVNHDYEISEADRTIILANSEPPRCLMDADLDGCISPADRDEVFVFLNIWLPETVCIGHAAYSENRSYDVNCDSCIDDSDVSAINSALKHGVNCPVCEEE